MVQFIADHRAVFGVEPICAVLPIAPSTYHRQRHQRTHPTRRSARAQRDDQLRVEIQRVYDEHQQVYGPRKVWKQLRRDGVRVARCTVARLMRAMGLAGAVRGRAWVTTTHAGEGGRPVDLVDRRFVATRPNQLWVSRFKRTSQPGAALSTSRSSSTCLRDALWAGGCRPPCARTLCGVVAAVARPSASANSPHSRRAGATRPALTSFGPTSSRTGPQVADDGAPGGVRGRRGSDAEDPTPEIRTSTPTGQPGALETGAQHRRRPGG